MGYRQRDGQQRAQRGCWACPGVGIEPVGKGAERKNPAWGLSELPSPNPAPVFLGDPLALLPSPVRALGPLHLWANPNRGNQRKRRHRKTGKAPCCKAEAAAESRTKPAGSRRDSAAQLEHRQQIGPSRSQLQRVPARLPSKAEVPGEDVIVARPHNLLRGLHGCKCCSCLARGSFPSTRCEESHPILLPATEQLPAERSQAPDFVSVAVVALLSTSQLTSSPAPFRTCGHLCGKHQLKVLPSQELSSWSSPLPPSPISTPSFI